MEMSAALSVGASTLEDKLSAFDTTRRGGGNKRRWYNPRELLQLVQFSSFWSHRWLGWVFVYAVVLLVFFIDRCVGLSALIAMYGTDDDRTAGVELAALGLGWLEDLICATYLVAVLWFIDFILSKAFGASSDSRMTVQTFIKWKRQRAIRRVVTFVTSWLLFVATVSPFAADILLVRLRSMRFTFEIVSMAINESGMVSSVAISSSEYQEACVTATIVFLVATFFAAIRTFASWADLIRWNPTLALMRLVEKIPLCSKEEEIELWTPKEDSEHDSSSDSYDDVSEILLENGKPVQYTQTVTPKRPSITIVRAVPLDELGSASFATTASVKESAYERFVIWCQSVDWLLRSVQLLVALLAFVLIPMAILAISQVSSPLVANLAMDTTINELFTRALKVSKAGFVPIVADGTIINASMYIHNGNEDFLRRLEHFPSSSWF